MDNFQIWPVGFIRSEIKNPKNAPKFYDEGAPAATIEIVPAFADGLYKMQPGDELIVITWLHMGDRHILKVHPRGNRANPLTGVFLTRSPNRPNPVGLHRAKVLSIDGNTLHIDAIEAIDGTPVIDIKPVVASNDH